MLDAKAAWTAAKLPGFQQIAFLTLAEKASVEFAGKRNAFTVNTFLPWASKIMSAHSAVGDCGL